MLIISKTIIDRAISSKLQTTSISFEYPAGDKYRGSGSVVFSIFFSECLCVCHLSIKYTHTKK